MVQLKLVTLNTWKGEGDYPARLSAMGDLLQNLDPDLVYLQEVLAVPGSDIDTAQTLATRLGLHAVSHAARRKTRLIGDQMRESTSGLAVLSRFDVRAAESVSLPSDSADGERIAQIVECDTGVPDLPPLVAVNLLLSHLRNARSLRQMQFAAACKVFAAGPASSAVIAGDFNDDPDARWIAEAIGGAAMSMRNGRDDPGMPDRSSTLVGVPEGDTGSCIDHFICVPPSIRFLDISLHGDASVSDHFAVRAVIEYGSHA